MLANKQKSLEFRDIRILQGGSKQEWPFVAGHPKSQGFPAWITRACRGNRVLCMCLRDEGGNWRLQGHGLLKGEPCV